MITENLIKNKGFEDVLIFVNGDSISVVIKSRGPKQRTNCTNTKYSI